MTTRHLPRRTRARRGFTLLELSVGLTIALLVSAASMQAYTLVRSQLVRGRVQAELGRNARNVLGFASRYVRLAGAGMPPATAPNGDPDAYPGGGVPSQAGALKTMGPAVLAARANAIGVIGDYARPDSNLNGLSIPAQGEGYQRYVSGGNHCPRGRRGELNDGGDWTNHITLLNELTGTCLAGSGCNTSTASVLIPGLGQGCDDSHLTEPTCPWGLNKLRPGEYLTVVYPDGRWLNRQIETAAFTTCCSDNDITVHTHCTGGGQYPGLSLFYNEWGGNSGGGQGGRLIPNTMSQGWTTGGDGALETVASMVLPYNRGWSATLERVFIRYRAAQKDVQFQMCWGPHARMENLFYDVDSANPCSLAGGSIHGGTNAKGGTGWHTLATNVTAFSMTYYDTNDTAITAPGLNNSTGTQDNALASIRRVQIQLSVSRTLAGSTITATESTSVQLRGTVN